MMLHYIVPLIACLASDDHWRADRSCGIASTYAFLRLSDVEVDYDKLVRLIPLDDQGASLFHLQKCCEDLGQRVRSVTALPRDLDHIAMPAIAHLFHSRGDSANKGHYVVLVGLKGANVYIIDPTTSALHYMLRADFLRAWSGYMLIRDTDHYFTSANATTSVGLLLAAAILVLCYRLRQCARVTLPAGVLLTMITGCGMDTYSSDRNEYFTAELAVWKNTHDLGGVLPNTTHEASYTLENTGRVPVRLESGRPSCHCLTTNLSGDTILAGCTEVLTMTIGSGNEAGPFGAFVRLGAVDQPWAATFSVSGVTVGARIDQEEVRFSDNRDTNITGDLFLKAFDDKCAISTSFRDPVAMPDGLFIENPVVADAKPFGMVHVRPFSLSLRIVPSHRGATPSSSVHHLTVTSTVGLVFQQHTVRIVIN